jgi:hypothetical protein
MSSFLLANPRRESLERIMRPVVKQWDATTKEPVPQHLLDLLARLK